MRKVVSYCKRHLAQGTLQIACADDVEFVLTLASFHLIESKMKETKSKEEMEETKSVKSLRNWGHDPLKY